MGNAHAPARNVDPLKWRNSRRVVFVGDPAAKRCFYSSYSVQNVSWAVILLKESFKSFPRGHVKGPRQDGPDFLDSWFPQRGVRTEVVGGTPGFVWDL
jgi:hypothetical protein